MVIWARIVYRIIQWYVSAGIPAQVGRTITKRRCLLITRWYPITFIASHSCHWFAVVHAGVSYWVSTITKLKGNLEFLFCVTLKFYVVSGLLQLILKIANSDGSIVYHACAKGEIWNLMNLTGLLIDVVCFEVCSWEDVILKNPGFYERPETKLWARACVFDVSRLG